MEDIYGKTIKIGEKLIDENGNVGKLLEDYGDRGIVDFGKGVGKDAVYFGDRIKKGIKW